MAARDRGLGPGPREAIPTHKALTKALRTSGAQAGEEAAIRRIMARRGVTKAEARAIALRRTAAGKNVAGIQAKGHDKWRQKVTHGTSSGTGPRPTTGGVTQSPTGSTDGTVSDGGTIGRRETTERRATTRKPKPKRGGRS